MVWGSDVLRGGELFEDGVVLTLTKEVVEVGVHEGLVALDLQFDGFDAFVWNLDALLLAFDHFDELEIRKMGFGVHGWWSRGVP
jgi:hypothetical protein